MDWETILLFIVIHMWNTNLYKMFLKDNLLFQHVRHFVRCRNDQTRNTLDLIITKDENNIEKIEILPSLGCSDHVILVFDFMCKFRQVYSGVGKYMYTKCDIECFSNIDWENKFENLNVEQICEAFASEFYENVKKKRSKI